jgi:4-azaleucine resistance transporter AzlC
MPQVQGARAEFIAGIRAFMPTSMSILPFGIVCGAAAVSAGMDALQAAAMSILIFAGSAQIAASQLYANSAPWLVILATGVIINLRFLMYAASLSQHFGRLARRQQALIAYLLTDQAFAVTSVHASGRSDPRHLHWFYLGFGAATWLCWQTATVAGIVLGNLVPANWSIDFIVPLTFIAMLVPLLTDLALICAAIAGGLAAVFLVLPLKLNLIVAALLGISVGLFVERQVRRRG